MGALLIVQVFPEFVEIQIGPPKEFWAATARTLPSAEEATACANVIPGTVRNVQASPEFVEVYTAEKKVAAMSLLPSAEDAIDPQSVVGALVCRVHVWANMELITKIDPQTTSVCNSIRCKLCD
jgi:hypothetical protein